MELAAIGFHQVLRARSGTAIWCQPCRAKGSMHCSRRSRTASRQRAWSPHKAKPTLITLLFLPGFVSRHPCLVPWQAVVDLDPRHFGANKNVKFGAHTGVIVQKTRWNAYGREVCGLARYRRAANPTKIAEASRSRLEALDEFFTSNQPEFVNIDMDVTGYMSPAKLPAIGAVTVSQRPCLIDLKSDAPAEATSPDRHYAPALAQQQNYDCPATVGRRHRSLSQWVALKCEQVHI